jgi:murein DD-endopeptidase MepM/ murein hydrolase activator NlpD
MANPLNIRALGNNLMLTFDDDTKRIAYATTNGVWLISSGTGTTDPGGGGDGTFMWPLDPASTSSEYGPRDGGAGSFHEGIDLAPAYGTNIACAGAGTVETDEWHSNFGNLLVIFHGTFDGYDWRTLYAHRVNSGPGVGVSVTKGQVIGQVGDSGFTFGAHLHHEVHRSGVGSGITWNLANDGGYRTAINPRDFYATYGG